MRNGPSDGAVLHQAINDAGDLTAPLEAWRDVYRAFGAKPQRTPCSAEALRKRAARGDVPVVDRLVDAYNSISVKHALPIGGEDLDHYVGPARLVRAGGGEDSEEALGQPESGEVIWRDDLGVTCRRWNWRQVARTRLTEETTSAVFLLEGLDTDLTPAAAMLAELIDADTVTMRAARMIGMVLAALSGLVWGVGDFAGGKASQRSTR